MFNSLLVQFLQRLLGYGLLGSNPEHKFAIFYGTGRNGKSTLLNTICYVFGEYAVTARPDVFTAKKFDGIPNEVARLANTRLVTTSELPDGARLNAALIKQLTGGDTVSARFLYQEYFDFQSQFLPIMATNYEPIIDGSDMALMRRLLLVPFRVTIEPGKQIKDLTERLKAEAPGILAWLVRGYREWQERGDLEPPPEVQAATKKYASESDQIGMFIEQCCDLVANVQLLAQELYSAYQSWAFEEGLSLPCEGNFSSVCDSSLLSSCRSPQGCPRDPIDNPPSGAAPEAHTCGRFYPC